MSKTKPLLQVRISSTNFWLNITEFWYTDRYVILLKSSSLLSEIYDVKNSGTIISDSPWGSNMSN